MLHILLRLGSFFFLKKMYGRRFRSVFFVLAPRGEGVAILREKIDLKGFLKDTYNLQHSPGQIKIYLLLFTFTRTKCIYFKRTIKFLFMVPIKNKYKRFCRTNLSNIFMAVEVKEWKGTKTWSFSYENYIISILTFSALKSCLQIFKK